MTIYKGKKIQLLGTLKRMYLVKLGKEKRKEKMF